MRYVVSGTYHEVSIEPLLDVLRQVQRPGGLRGRGSALTAEDRGTLLVNRLRSAPVITRRFEALGETKTFMVRQVPARVGRTGGIELTIATDTVAVEGVRIADIAWAQSRFGAQIVDEGDEGKKLLRVPRGADGGVGATFALAEQLLERNVAAAHPNFVRVMPRVRPSRAVAAERQWAHVVLGVREAWERTRGRPEIAVAVLDDGVDTGHPALKPAVVAERDFIGGTATSAMPSRGEAHGTACAGIIVSRDTVCQGVAPRASLIAARIAMDDGQGNWLSEDYTTADAIDWAWRSGASVLSISGSGGPPSDLITRALERARTLGRHGLGAVVAVAAGDDQGLVRYPATAPGVLAVGASNQFDERKTRSSRDGEPWGSCYGPAVALLAPAVGICTTDVTGTAGYGPGNLTSTFNGTSAAAPHVSAAAALVLSVAPGLRAAQVCQLLIETAHRLGGQRGWTPELGHGRLDVAAAVSAATVPVSPTIVGGLAHPGRRRHGRSWSSSRAAGGRAARAGRRASGVAEPAAAGVCSGRRARSTMDDRRAPKIV